MLTIFFRAEVPTHFAEVKCCDLDAFGRFHRACLNRGVYLPPSQFESAFLPACLTDEDIDFAIAGITDALRSVVL
jgi:glutamate-1-semialdehyde 2,1-aminomutase